MKAAIRMERVLGRNERCVQTLSRRPIKGWAPYLARFWRDVGYLNCLLTHAQATPKFPDHRFADPREDETGRGHPLFPAHPLCPGAPRTSVRGLTKTGRSPIKALSFSLLGSRLPVRKAGSKAFNDASEHLQPPQRVAEHFVQQSLRSVPETEGTGYGTRRGEHRQAHAVT